MTQVVEYGFWASSPSDTSKYPWPKVSIVPDREFLARVVAVQAEACQVMRYRGLSWSRLDGRTLGCHEFVVRDPSTGAEVRWPGDYASHYLAAGVPPETGFVALVEQVYANLPSRVSPPPGP